ncbi:MAG: glycoside hydrolase family 95-like protein [Odoribacter sp.]
MKKGYSAFTYKPFTLEGNFACAAAIQEMLLQSHTGIIRVFPAIPEAWRDASFRNMRAMGAFLVDADYENGKVKKVVVRSERGGLLKIVNPFTGKEWKRKWRPGKR